ncbi:MAG: trypsin-like peptidase domain-containing protein [Deltaproteobacteria bacterium]|nr:trypsin-like peptidase domain-containing protein [Deltaproteobacteria bacterium]
MTSSGSKAALLVVLALLATAQIVLLAVYAFLPWDVRRPGPRSAVRASVVSMPGAIQPASCSTEDLGVAVSRVRASVAYITGHRQTTGISPSRGPISFSEASLTGDKMGSGIIFDPKGFILTNYHVISDTSELRASVFGDRGMLYPCEVVYSEPSLDLAVIRIQAPYDLPAASLGNSDMLETGEEVLAIGSPFNLEQSVTHGIVSDTKRTVTIDGRNYEDLLQTDAAINSGNSGGALINTSGEVVGINVAIYAPSRVYCGVGFAIPINRAKLLLMKIKYPEGKS